LKQRRTSDFGDILNPLTQIFKETEVTSLIFSVVARSMAHSILGRPVKKGGHLQDYIYAVERRYDYSKISMQELDNWNSAVYHRLISRLASNPWTRANEHLLDEAIEFVRSGIWAGSKFNTPRGVAPLLQIVNQAFESYRDPYKESVEGERQCCQKAMLLVSLALPIKFDFQPWQPQPKQLSEWIINTVLGFDTLLTLSSGKYGQNYKNLIMHHIVKVSIPAWNETEESLDQGQILKLTRLESCPMKLIGSLVGGNTILPETIQSHESTDELLPDVAYFWCKEWGKRSLSSKYGPLRAFIDLGRPALTREALGCFQEIEDTVRFKIFVNTYLMQYIL
jgi:hypothetical protein